ncbi:pentapeptide repeat-containing protein [Thalassotalea sp. G2M2-11]|uniref:pentapeptide repeat-containing protein n=1 Tax=Thalassotalea sp. G2M2-11 TaxID=2787627 RepID=UPI0019D088DB|nr:pentapeptide repeat-containing protein [Thalassotalea sp. G2M2-11]
MTQEELDLIIKNHQLWLNSEGSEGQQADFNNEIIDCDYEHAPQSMRVKFHKGGGLEAVGGVAFVNGQESKEHRPSHFTALNFGQADLRGALFKNALFYKCDMSEVNFSACDLSEAKFAEVKLTKAKFGGFFEPPAKLNGVTFIRCDLTHNFLQQHDLSYSELSGTDFSDSNMISTVFKESTAVGAKFKSVSLSGADFSGCSLSNAEFVGSDLTAANFSLARLKLATFVNSNLAGAIGKQQGYFKRLKEAFNSKRESNYVGCRIDGSYGNERFKKAINEEAYVEEFSSAHPHWYKLWLISSDCGRSMRLWSVWSLVIALIFAIAYFNIGVDGFTFNDQITKLIKAGDFFPFFYYSVVTFTTLGFGDITPINSLAMGVVILEVIIGFVMLGLLISILANKVASRS